MQKLLNRLIHENIQIYKIWFWYKQKVKKRMLKVRLPKKGDDFYMDGYPRSGNTFCLAFSKIAFPSAAYAHHLHSLAPLKLALSYNIPTIVLLRNPKDCITSLILLKSHYKKGFSKNINNLEALIDNYSQYYQFVIENRNRIHLLPFETTIELPALLTFFSKALNVELNLSEKQLKEIEASYKDRQSSKPLERTNKPSEQKNKEKEKIFKMISDLESFLKARKIYESLADKS